MFTLNIMDIHHLKRFLGAWALGLWLLGPVLLCSGCGKSPVTEQTADSQGETALEHARKHLNPTYVCPMHPQIIRDEPGTCPLCGMALVAQKTEAGGDEQRPMVHIAEGIIQNMGVRTAAVERGGMWKYIKTIGYVDYNEKRLVTVRATTQGWVENLGVRREGLLVTKGQLLMELYSPEFLAVQKEFLAAQEKDRSDILHPYGQRQESVGPRDHLRYLEVPESLVEEIARTGRIQHRIPIYAPQHGVLVRHLVSKHMVVWPGQPMFTIADLSSVWVEARIYEHQLEWVSRGLNAEVESDAFPGRRWEAHVNYIYPELDPATRTLKVRLLVPNPDGALKPNMAVQAVIYGGPKQDILKIPRAALIASGERESVVKALGDGRFQPVDVVTGMHSGGEVEILDGLAEGDRVVVSGQFLIDSESNLQASFMRFGAGE